MGRRRRGFSLVEVLFAILLFCTVAAITLSLFFQGHRVNRRLDYRLQALSAVHLIRARLAHDLASSVAATGGTSAVEDALSISFWRIQSGDNRGVYGSCLDENLKPITERVHYQFDTQKRVLLRNGVALTALGLRDLRFHYRPRESLVAGDDIQVEMTLVPDESKSKEKVDEYMRVTLDFHRTSTTWKCAFKEYVGD